MQAGTRRQLLWLSLFTLAMAQLEATVVVYLREIYYPDGFRFPLVIIRDHLATIEIAREAATVLMLLGVAKLFSRHDPWRQYAAFLYAFGLWDVLYYAWLWAMLRWPTSLLDWDVLFLIPMPWLGPVLAPLLIALVMMAAGILLLQRRDAGHAIEIRRSEWGIVIACALGLIAVFCRDAAAVVEGEIPRPFAWFAFVSLLGIACVVCGRILLRTRRRG